MLQAALYTTSLRLLLRLTLIVLTTKNQGKLDILFNYFGLVISKMIVNQTVNEKVSTYEFEFDSTIFVKHYKEFLLNHMKQWDTRYAFSGEDVIIAFFNEVLSQSSKKTPFSIS